MKVEANLDWRMFGKICASVTVLLLVVGGWCVLFTVEKEVARSVLVSVGTLVLLLCSIFGVIFIWGWIWS